MVLGDKMVSAKELKSIDLTSYTINMTAISVIFSILFALFVTLSIGIYSPQNIGASIYLISTIIVGTFMFSIYNFFCEGLLYNLLTKKLNNIQVIFGDNGEILKINSSQTATIIAIILTIQAILLYLVSVFILPLVLNATIQTLILSGQQMAALGLYQIMALISQPIVILLFIFGCLIISFVYILLGCYVYNILARKGRLIELGLSKENNLTAIDSIDPKKFAIVFSIICLVLNIITAIISIMSGGTIQGAIFQVIGSFVVGFIFGLLFTILYNYTASKTEKIKLELIDI